MAESKKKKEKRQLETKEMMKGALTRLGLTSARVRCVVKKI